MMGPSQSSAGLGLAGLPVAAASRAQVLEGVAISRTRCLSLDRT
jgi:hypothetical protein